MFDDLFSSFVMQGVEPENPTPIGAFVRVQSPESLQSGE